VTLQELLDKCQRDELTSLAELMEIDAEPLGLSQLSRALERAIRRAGGQGIANLARGGEGPSYDAIVRDVAKHLDVSVDGTTEALEEAIVDAWLARTWDAGDTQSRMVLQRALQLDTLPRLGQSATELGHKLHGRGWAFQASVVAGMTLGLGVLSFLLRPLMVPLAGVMALKSLAPELDKTVPAVVQLATLRQQVRHRVTVGIVGSPSCGKDSALRALFGIDTGNVHPVAGATREVGVFRVPGATALFVVNTPGLGDVVEEVTEAARQVLDHIDVFLYVLNAEGGVQARELEDFTSCLTTRKPVLVAVNKIDTLRPKDRERYLRDAREKLGGRGFGFVACAFDPLGPISEHPINTDLVHDWLVSTLTRLGKAPDELPPLPTPSTRWELDLG